MYTIFLTFLHISFIGMLIMGNSLKIFYLSRKIVIFLLVLSIVVFGVFIVECNLNISEWIIILHNLLYITSVGIFIEIHSFKKQRADNERGEQLQNLLREEKNLRIFIFLEKLFMRVLNNSKNITSQDIYEQEINIKKSETKLTKIKEKISLLQEYYT